MVWEARSAAPTTRTVGGSRTSDGRIWFTTSRGQAVFDPHTRWLRFIAPIVQITEMTTDGHEVDLAHAARISPDVELIRIRYTAIHLSAPEEISYYYRLSGLKSSFISAGGRRERPYNTLKHGHYHVPGARATSRRPAF